MLKFWNMNEIIKVKLEKDFKENGFEYFFTLLSERSDYLNNLWIEELEKKFNKKFKPIFVLNAERNKFFKMDNYIIINERLYRLQKKLKNERIIFQSESDDLNREFSDSKFIKSLINKLILKQKRVFILSWTTSGLFLNNPKVIILGPNPKIATKYDSKLEHVKLFKKLNLPRNEVKIYKNFAEVQKIKGIFYPFFLSADFSSGGQESKIITSQEDLEKFYPWLRTKNRNTKFLVAKLVRNIISAPNTSAIVIDKNNTEMLCISDQILHDTKYLGNIYPARISKKTRRIITEATKKIGNHLSKLGFRGLFGCDFLINSKDNCYITDLNPRRQGGYLCNALMFLPKGVNIIEMELKLALGEEVTSPKLQDISIDYAWAHSKIKPPHPNYQILSTWKFGEPDDPFLKPDSTFKMTFFPEKYLYVAGTAGYCIVSGTSRNKVEKKINKIAKEMATKYFTRNRTLPQNYFDQAEILNLLQ